MSTLYIGDWLIASPTDKPVQQINQSTDKPVNFAVDKHASMFEYLLANIVPAFW